MDVSKIKLVAFDLDGTLTQHKTPLSDEHRAVLDQLAEKYKLVMLGAGMCRRIFEQMDRFPVDILGNYGNVPVTFKSGNSIMSGIGLHLCQLRSTLIIEIENERWISIPTLN